MLLHITVFTPSQKYILPDQKIFYEKDNTIFLVHILDSIEAVESFMEG